MNLKLWALKTLAIAGLFSGQLFAQEIGLGEFQNKWSGTYGPAEIPGTQNYVAFVEGNSLPSYIEETFEGGRSFDRKFVKVIFKVSDLTKLSGMELRLSSDESGYENFFAIPVPLFTDIDFNTVQSNAWVTYTFTMGEAKTMGNPDLTDIKRLGFYLGGEKVKIEFKKIEVFDSFPHSIVSFTFDDGYDDHYEAAKIMADFDYAGTAYLMPRQLNQKDYLTTEQVRDMKELYGWDLASHHKIPIVDFEYNDLENEFFYTQGYLAGLGGEEDAYHFAYPLGKQNRRTTLPLMRRMFKSARIAGGGAETLPPADWHMLRTFNVMPHISPMEILERVRTAREQGEWLILMFHYLTDEKNPENPLAYNTKDFAILCELLAEEQARVMTVREVYQAFHQ